MLFGGVDSASGTEMYAMFFFLRESRHRCIYFLVRNGVLVSWELDQFMIIPLETIAMFSDDF